MGQQLGVLQGRGTLPEGQEGVLQGTGEEGRIPMRVLQGRDSCPKGQRGAGEEVGRECL